MKVYKVVEVEHPVRPKPPPLGETAESGHWHGDEWHAEPHPKNDDTARVERVEALNPPQQGDGAATTFRKQVSAKYPPLKTTEAVDEFLKTASQEEIYARTRDMYIARHYNKYPDCTEHTAVFEDAKNYDEWAAADRAYMDIYWEHHYESVRISDELLALLKKYNYRSAYEATHIPESERLNDIERIKTLMAKMQEHGERRDAQAREKPIKPQPMHTH